MTQILTQEKLAELLDVGPRTIRRWREHGLPAYRPGGRKLFFILDEVIEWIKEGEKERSGSPPGF